MSHRNPWPLLTLLTGLLAACSGAPTTPGAGTGGLEVTVTVTDPAYGVHFDYVTSASFEYALTPLSGFTPSAAEQALLAAVNAERTRGGTCPVTGGGTRSFAPTAPLNFEGHLYKSASLYARELAAAGRVDSLPHRSRLDNSVPSQRMVTAGYRPVPPAGVQWVFEESLAAGTNLTDPAEIVGMWKGSPGHCAALYEPMPARSHGAVARADGNVAGQATMYYVLNIGGW